MYVIRWDTSLRMLHLRLHPVDRRGRGGGLLLQLVPMKLGTMDRPRGWSINITAGPPQPAGHREPG